MKMNNALTKFKSLHKTTEPLLLANVWDANSAKIAENAGYKALGSSSHAIANAMGYEDGEEISFEELLFVLQTIVKAVKIPLSVDFEAGYSDDPKQVAKMVKKLEDIGVVGINLEDGKVVKGKRKLVDPKILVSKIKAIRKVSPIFINARIDTYTTKHKNPLEESLKRAKLYAEAGADGIFVPLIETAKDIKTFTEKVKLPLNVFTTENLPTYGRLGKLGVKRISHGAKQYELLMKNSEKIFKEFLKNKKYSTILG